MEDLEEIWDQLQLNAEKFEQIEVNLGINENIYKYENQNLVGKVMVDQFIRKEVIQKTMEKIWNVSKPILFQDLKANSFIITFAYERDHNQILGESHSYSMAYVFPSGV